MTLGEWGSSQERRWAGRGAREYLACEGGQVRGALHVGGRQFALLVEPGCDASAEALLRAHGFEPGEEYTLFALRTAPPVREMVRERAGRVVATRG